MGEKKIQKQRLFGNVLIIEEQVQKYPLKF